MLYLDIPTLPELLALRRTRADAAISIYLPTTPVTQDAQSDRTALRNLAGEALGSLDGRLDKRRLATLSSHFEELAEDDEFWAHQAYSLAIMATPDRLRAYRLPNKLSSSFEVSDRFNLKPLLRAVTFPHEAFVLILQTNGVRVLEVAPDLPPEEVRVPDMPRDAASVAGVSTISGRSPHGRVQGGEGKKLRLHQYARRVDEAMRALLAGRDTPLILAAAEPLDAIYRSVCFHPRLLREGLSGAAAAAGTAEIAKAAAEILARAHGQELSDINGRFDVLAGQSRATSEVTTAARAATFGAVDTLVVDMDRELPGTIDEETGAVIFASEPGPDSYDILGEIAGRAAETGARVFSARRQDMPENSSIAALLRRPI